MRDVISFVNIKNENKTTFCSYTLAAIHFSVGQFYCILKWKETLTNDFCINMFSVNYIISGIPVNINYKRPLPIFSLTNTVIKYMQVSAFKIFLVMYCTGSCENSCSWTTLGILILQFNTGGDDISLLQQLCTL